MENGINIIESFEEFYEKNIFIKFKENLKQNISVKKEDIITLFNKGLLNNNSYYNLSRSIALNLLQTYQNDKLCDMTETYWTGLVSNYAKPSLNDDSITYLNKNNNGDFDTKDGNYSIKFEKYTVTVKVKRIYGRMFANFVFKFDENNEDSLKKFFELFYDIFKQNYIEYLFQKRIEEIIDGEINSFMKLNSKILKTINYDTKTDNL